MAGITSTELKLPRIRKRTWIGLILISLFVCGLLLLPGILYFNFQVDWRVTAAIHMIPDADLRYNHTSEKNGFRIKKVIYWINSPFEQVKDYPFVTNYREHSDPHMGRFSETTSNYSYQIYYLSDHPQKEIDSMLYFAPSDIGGEPFDVTSLSFYIISANWVGDKDYSVNELDYERLAGKETTGTYVVYTYRLT